MSEQIKIKLKKEEAILAYKALKSKYESQISDAIYHLNLYFNNSVGIGEHSKLLDEMDVYVAKLAEAKDKLETLENSIVNENN